MLGETALGVYRYVISHQGHDDDVTAFDLGLTVGELETARRELTEAGLLQESPGDISGVIALDPEIALASAVYGDEKVVHDTRARIAQRRADYLALVPHFNEARNLATLSEATEVVEDLGTIRDYLADMCRRTRQELLIAHPNRHISAASLQEGRPQDLQMLSRGVIRKSLYLKANRDSAAVQRAVADLTDAGAEVRVLPLIPLRVMCFDGRSAMLSRGDTSEDKAAIVVRDTNVAAAIRQVFLAAWECAEPFCSRESDDTLPTELDLAILASLATGMSDEQIARRQDISVRTCRRHVHDLMERLGALNRFQAGVLAARKEWI